MSVRRSRQWSSSTRHTFNSAGLTTRSTGHALMCAQLHLNLEDFLLRIWE